MVDSGTCMRIDHGRTKMDLMGLLSFITTLYETSNVSFFRFAPKNIFNNQSITKNFTKHIFETRTLFTILK